MASPLHPRIIVLFLALLLGVGLNTVQSKLPDRPNPPRLVNDMASLLSKEDAARLEQKLVAYERSHSTQIAIVITRDMEGYELADFATRLGSHWGIGQQGFENGVLVLIVPGDDQGRRLLHIAVGYGLEAVIPDITAKRIIDQELAPSFRNGNYYEGLEQATNVVMQLAAGEFPASEYMARQEEVPSGALLIPLVIVFLLIFTLSRRANAYASPGKNIPFWTLFWLMSHGSKGSKGSWGNFSSGSGGFGGGRSSGGFGGFGGGRFGGGGASGSW